MLTRDTASRGIFINRCFDEFNRSAPLGRVEPAVEVAAGVGPC